MDTSENGLTRQYLTFALGDDEFAIEIGKVREVLDFTSITFVPNMPGYIRGVINLRGNVVPVVDLKMKLNMGKAEPTVNSCIVIVDSEFHGEAVQVGALTDSVHEVLDLDDGRVVPPPGMGLRMDTAYVSGIGRLDGRFILILDIGRVMSEEGAPALGSDEQFEALPAA